MAAEFCLSVSLSHLKGSLTIALIFEPQFTDFSSESAGLACYRDVLQSSVGNEQQKSLTYNYIKKLTADIRVT
jgi:hypothetical protein